MGAFGLVCSAKDQLTGSSVAIKKIMKPFSTPVLSKRTYRELKLLKHIQHENIISLSDVFISPLEDMYAALQPHSPFTPSPLRTATSLQSYSARISIVF